MRGYVANIRTPYDDLIDRRKEQTMWLLGPTYDYQYNSQFYDPDYDYSVVAKFDSIPGVSIFDQLKNVEQLIALKRETPEAYYQEVVKTVETNNLVESMSDRVKNNYHLHMRHEIFSTMTTLFSEGKYLAFITTATIQLEGMLLNLF